MNIDLTHLRRLLAEASPRPWSHRSAFEIDTPNSTIEVTEHDHDLMAESDAALICAAVNALPALIEEVERLRAELKECADSLEEALAYAPEWAREKWFSDDPVARARAALEGGK